eukprot:12888997-Prorocentrum_lima.AAC.1
MAFRAALAICAAPVPNFSRCQKMPSRVVRSCVVAAHVVSNRPLEAYLCNHNETAPFENSRSTRSNPSATQRP